MRPWKKNGYTLVELVIALAVMAIVASVAVVSLNSYQEFIGNSRKKADEQNARVLNVATGFYAQTMQVDRTNAFSGISGDGAKISLLYEKGYISEIPVPLQKDAAFLWDGSLGLWSASTGDPYLNEVKNAMIASSISLDTFLSKQKQWGSFNSKNYSVNNWNGYLEYLLEKGSGDTTRLVSGNPGYGSNTLGLSNPVSGETGIIDYNNYQSLWGSFAAYIPPAILITNEYDYNKKSDQTEIQENLSKFAGTLIINKSNSGVNENVQVYYVKEDGTFSELIPIEVLLDND